MARTALAAADSGATEMAPFRVEAEFGVDGLRIQNSTSVLNQYQLDQHAVSKYYWPERLEIIDQLPRNPSGKVQKFLLREQAKSLRPQPQQILEVQSA